MPHRFHRPVLGGDVRRRRPRARGPGDGGARPHLVHRGDRLALLFTPPFDKTALDPGYIKGYPPGIRENGGQYTHAAAWSIMGFAALGQGDKAAELFALVNPINHTSTRAGVLRYKVEPYVVAADVYSVAPHVGRGGWTWYTGSAGWLYRAGIEAILGLRIKGGSAGDRSLHPDRLAGLRDDSALSRRGLRDLGPKSRRRQPGRDRRSVGR